MKVERLYSRRNFKKKQQGAALIVGLIMLVLITIVVVGAYILSSSNAKSVGNIQIREEAIAAANAAVEQLISSPFTNALGPQVFQMDLNHDGTMDYTVNIATPVCLRAVIASASAPSDVELGAGMSSGNNWLTDWDIDATVIDAATGANVRVRQGVRVLLGQTAKDAVCP